MPQAASIRLNADTRERFFQRVYKNLILKKEMYIAILSGGFYF
jgi:hypothetical protein